MKIRSLGPEACSSGTQPRQPLVPHVGQLADQRPHLVPPTAALPHPLLLQDEVVVPEFVVVFHVVVVVVGVLVVGVVVLVVVVELLVAAVLVVVVVAAEDFVPPRTATLMLLATATTGCFALRRIAGYDRFRLYVPRYVPQLRDTNLLCAPRQVSGPQAKLPQFAYR